MDGTITILNPLFKHLVGNKTHARLLYTIQPHILAMRLTEHFELSHNLVGWIMDFLTNRTQRMKVNDILSDSLCLSTDSPKGCVFSPLLYILYKNMYQSKHENRILLKSTNDSVTVSLLHGNKSRQSLMSLSPGVTNLYGAKHIQDEGYDCRFQNSCFNL